jgi:hypothetical protein
MIAVSNVLAPFIQITAQESGERHVFVVTSARLPPEMPLEGGTAGASTHVSKDVARGVDGQEGGGM